MPKVYEIHILREDNLTQTNISDAPIKDVYAMLYSAVALVSEKTNQSVLETLSVIAQLDRFVKNSGQG